MRLHFPLSIATPVTKRKAPSVAIGQFVSFIYSVDQVLH